RRLSGRCRAYRGLLRTGTQRRGLPELSRAACTDPQRGGVTRTMTTDCKPEELLIAFIADRLAGLRHVAVGNSSPIPGAAALLARARSDGALRVSLLGSRKHTAFTDGGKELFDCAAEGRIDAFFLGGGQIDGEANINLVGIGDYPQTKVRFPGAFGSAYLYFLVPQVIL